MAMVADLADRLETLQNKQEEHTANSARLFRVMESKTAQQLSTLTNRFDQQLAQQLDQVRADTSALVSNFIPDTDAAALGPGVATGATAPTVGTHLHAALNPAGADPDSGMVGLAAGATTGGAALPAAARSATHSGVDTMVHTSDTAALLDSVAVAPTAPRVGLSEHGLQKLLERTPQPTKFSGTPSHARSFMYAVKQ